MSKKLNSFILPDDVIKNMKDKTRDTKSARVELGFGLCTNKYDNVIRKGTECTGNRCSMKAGLCATDQIHIGDYHTHPMSESTMSITDMVTGCSEDIECIGSAPYGSIKCFVRKTDKSQCFKDISPFEPEEHRLLIKDEEISSSIRHPTSIIKKGIVNFLKEIHQYDIDVSKYHQNRYKLLTQNFDTVKIK